MDNTDIGLTVVVILGCLSLGMLCFMVINSEIDRTHHETICVNNGMAYDWSKDSCVPITQKPWANEKRPWYK